MIAVTSALFAPPADASPTETQRSLVLAGGGMRVAYQAGVLAALEQAGLRFHHVDGASGGTMNLSMLLGGQDRPGSTFLWGTLGRSGQVGADMGLIYADLTSQSDIDTLVANLTAAMIAKGKGSAWLHNAERWALNAIFRREANHVARSERGTPTVALTATGQAGLRAYLGPVRGQLRHEWGQVPEEVSFVYGHTHKPFTDRWSVAGFPARRFASSTPGAGWWTRPSPRRSRQVWRCWSTMTWTRRRCSSTGRARPPRPLPSSSSAVGRGAAIGLAHRTGIPDRPGGGAVGLPVGSGGGGSRPAPPAPGRDGRRPQLRPRHAGQSRGLDQHACPVPGRPADGGARSAGDGLANSLRRRPGVDPGIGHLERPEREDNVVPGEEAVPPRVLGPPRETGDRARIGELAEVGHADAVSHRVRSLLRREPQGAVEADGLAVEVHVLGDVPGELRVLGRRGPCAWGTGPRRPSRRRAVPGRPLP